MEDEKQGEAQTRPFDASNYLQNDEDIAAYLQAAALGDVAKARGMTQLARDTGLSRESLYKSLSGERAPNSDTLFKVLRAMGFKLNVQPVIPQ